MISLRGLSKQFGTRTAVDDLSLEVPAGEIFGLLGHNGAGKSTVIGMLLGQVWPSAGEIRVCGHNILSARGRALQKVGAIFETPCFYDYLSGLRNLQIFSSYTAPMAPARIREVIEWVGLSGREHAKVRTYSHGMRARLALAQTLLPRPDLLILDEPSDGLDPEGIHEMRQTILRLHREFGITILLSSHLLNEVEQLCTRIAVLNVGRKVFEGTLADTRRRQDWVKLRTSDFAGAARQLASEGLITRERDGAYVALAEGVGIDRVVAFLVGAGRPVYEAAPEEETLERFYLSLMNSERQSQRGGN
jgi:ABC-2 type transport system ATP-binding protein